MRWTHFLILFVVLGFLKGVEVQAQEAIPATSATQSITDADWPDVESLNYMQIKMHFDEMIDPDIDKASITVEIDEMVARIKAMAGPGADDNRKFATLRHFVYESGDWNDNRPFSYDLDDPLGTNIENKLISTYLRTRKGNCVSMPILILILGERLGLEMTLSTAPTHVFIQYHDKAYDEWVNIETTSGSNPARSEYLRENFPMTDLAIENGIYLKRRDRNEIAAVMAGTVVEYYSQEERLEDVATMSELILRNDNTNISAILWRASAYGRMMERDFHIPYPQPDMVPTNLVRKYKFMAAQNQGGYKHAESLGWKPE